MQSIDLIDRIPVFRTVVVWSRTQFAMPTATSPSEMLLSRHSPYTASSSNALVTECYNTCFVIEDNGQYFMVDGGGGSAILHQLKHAGYDWMDMRHIFVTHKHVDHLMGIIWMVRMIWNH